MSTSSAVLQPLVRTSRPFIFLENSLVARSVSSVLNNGPRNGGLEDPRSEFGKMLRRPGKSKNKKGLSICSLI